MGVSNDSPFIDPAVGHPHSHALADWRSGVAGKRRHAGVEKKRQRAAKMDNWAS